MSDDRILLARQRIDAAIARIEAADTDSGTSPNATGDQDLQRRYALLKSEASEAKQQIDRLIEGLEG